MTQEEDKAVILVVDDKSANVLALQELLADDTRILLGAESGEEALKIMLTRDVNLIILDVQMPGMDGFEVAQVLQLNKKTKGIPIIFATADHNEHFVLKGYGEGAIDYLHKPLNPDIVKAKVAVLLKLELQKKALIEKNLAQEIAEKQIRELNAHLQNTIRQLEVSNKELESFSYSISHDLRAPLRAINGYSSILQELHASALNEDAQTLLHKIMFNVERMGTLIDDLLAFSKLGRQDIKRSALDMKELVTGVLAEALDATSNTTVTMHELYPAEADQTLLRQVWVNLVSNAIKYSGKKTDPTIEIGSNVSENEVTYYIKDNGAGFDMKYADKLFGVFQRLHKTTEFEGTGVGLAIVQRIIAKHRGRVWAKGIANEGATFYFTLPLTGGQ